MNRLEAQDHLAWRYRELRKLWIGSPEIRDAAATIGLSEREWAYRSAYALGPITWTASDGAAGWKIADDAAWEASR